jgi:magnesium-transporting ATPase (P-type)
MTAFAAVAPDDAEVLRNARWVRYDASCLVVGDVLRLDVHDVVPADCVIIAHGFRDELLLVGHESEETGHGEDDDDDEEKSMIQSKAYAVAVDNNDNYEDDDEVGVLSVDARLITGQSDMTHYYSPPSSSSMSSTSSSKSSLQTLLYGSRIVNGSCIAIVTAIGNDVVLSKLITTRRWPPKYDLSHEIII